MNLVELEGNVTKDVLLKADGKYCYVNVAVGRTRSSGTDFISCKVFGEVAASCAGSLTKGDRVAVTGHISSGSFTPKGAKDKVYRTDIVVDTIRKIPKGGGQASAGGFIDDTVNLAAKGIAA
ncbi:MAG: single-stranded DNA-binding protein [Firmicutes bacterium]|nr:single-stranded DNA-binding protein [Bacillota bacterium]